MKTDCQEVKKIFGGKKKIYPCKLLQLNENRGVLKYKLKKVHHVQNIILKPDYITYAFYWPEKPFNLYKWEDQEGYPQGNYFNVADKVRLSRESFFWRDLFVDILVTSGEQKTYIIDEEEIPENIDRRLKEHIFDSQRYILQNYSRIIAETDRIVEEIKQNN